MRILKNGIQFHLLKKDDIEMVRQWRNDPSVVKNYGFREYITPEMQKDWFQSINNINNLYLIIEYEGEKIGVVNAKNIDYKKRTYESGIFIPEGKYSKTFLPGIVMIMTMESGFKMFGLDRIFAHILKTNSAVKSMILSFGFEISPDQENKKNQLYFITKENFEEKAIKLVKAMSVLTGNQETGKIIVDRNEMSDKVVQDWEKVIRKNAMAIRIEETPEQRIYYLS